MQRHTNEQSAVIAYFDRLIKQNTEERERRKMPIFEDEQDDDASNRPKPEKKRRKELTGVAKQLRLRQALSHLYCLERFLMEDLDNDILTSLLSDLKAIQVKRKVVEQLEADEVSRQGLCQYQVGLDVLRDQEHETFGGYFDISKIIEMVAVRCKLKSSNCSETGCSSQNPMQFMVSGLRHSLLLPCSFY